jgi:cobalt-zinc-cadmium resistance protein CzcA
MLERLISFSLKNRMVVLLAVAVLAVAGTWALRTIPIDAFPDVTNIQVEVISTAPGLSPLEIEQFVTYPIETSMRGLPGLVLMRSVTKYGISVVTLVFRDDVDIYFARQQVHERVSDVERKLPAGVGTEMGPVATAMGEIYQYTLEVPKPATGREAVSELTRQRTLQDWVVAPILKSVPGVTEVNSFGGYIQQFQVLVDPDKLLKYDLAVEAVHEAIRTNNSNVGGNVVAQRSEEYIIRGVGLIRSAADIGRIVLKSEGGTAVFVDDVAERHPNSLVILADDRREVLRTLIIAPVLSVDFDLVEFHLRGFGRFQFDSRPIRLKAKSKKQRRFLASCRDHY